MQKVDKLKSVIAPFLKLTPSEVNSATVIDRRAVKGSIMVHRMYAVLEREGFEFPKRKAFATFGELLAVLCGEEGHENVDHVLSDPSAERNAQSFMITDVLIPQNSGMSSVGIDVEVVSNMTEVTNYRDDSFYRQNFSEREIAYCILQKSPTESFCGKFCAKEAIIKADPSYSKVPFNQIEVLNDKDGRPYFDGFSVSISHTAELAVAIALKITLEHKSIDN